MKNSKFLLKEKIFIQIKIAYCLSKNSKKVLLVSAKSRRNIFLSIKA
jgi:hypothetical protein